MSTACGRATGRDASWPLGTPFHRRGGNGRIEFRSELAVIAGEAFHGLPWCSASSPRPPGAPAAPHGAQTRRATPLRRAVAPNTATPHSINVRLPGSGSGLAVIRVPA